MITLQWCQLELLRCAVSSQPSAHRHSIFTGLTHKQQHQSTEGLEVLQTVRWYIPSVVSSTRWYYSMRVRLHCEQS